MLPRSQRLTVSAFAVAFAEGRVVRHPLLQLRVQPRGDGNAATRAAFGVAKKLGKASLRNRVRRRVRERYRLSTARYNERGRENLAGCDLIFLANAATVAATTAQLDEAVAQLLARAAHQVKSQKGQQTRLGKTIDGSTEDATSPATAALDVKPAAPAVISCAARNSLRLIRFYQRYISPLTPPSCRFQPTCSRYTYQAIERFGFRHGIWLGLRRLCKCQPFHAGGYDPLPEWEPEPARKVKNNICTQ